MRPGVARTTHKVKASGYVSVCVTLKARAGLGFRACLSVGGPDGRLLPLVLLLRNVKNILSSVPTFLCKTNE